MTELSRAEMERIIHDFFNAHERKDANRHYEYIHDDIEFSFPEMELADPTGHMAKGKDTFIAMQSTDFATLPDLACPVDRILIDGQTAVIQGRMTATDLSRMADLDVFQIPGQPRLDMTDRRLNMRHTFVFDFQDGKIIKIMCYYDLFNYMIIQLGMNADLLLQMRDMSAGAAPATA
jgi:ketosteroid isomerase-like protein